ncbi:uncharacterized protein [Lepisosteus oculatus]
MTIGKSAGRSVRMSSRRSRAYGRLQEAEAERESGRRSGQEAPEPGVFHFNRGMLEDDGGAALLRAGPERRSSRWRRESKRKDPTGPGLTGSAAGVPADAGADWPAVAAVTAPPQPALVHFGEREEADDRSLIAGRKRSERAGPGEGAEAKKLAKPSALKRYRKAIDSAFRRGWETFIANLYNVTLTPISSPSPSSSPPPRPARLSRTASALVEYR